MVVPVRLAFADDDPVGWVVAYAVVDISFLIDIILTFFTTYTDEITDGEVTNHKKIVVNYLKGWFWFDALSIVPFDYIMNNSDYSFNSLFRFAKFGKIYKIVRLTRLAKVFKLLKKNKNQMMSRFSEKLSINSGVERLMMFSFFLGIFTHVSACLFIMLSDVERTVIDWTWV